MNCALFGLGRAGMIHYKNIVNNTSLKLKYIFDKNSEKLKDKIEHSELLTIQLKKYYMILI